MKNNYVELQTISNFSFLYGASFPEEFVAQAVCLSYASIALTDRHTFSGMVRAHTEAKKLGIRLIVGVQIPLFNLETREELPLSLYLYPCSKKAYSRICGLLTKGKMRADKGECILDIDDMSEVYEDTVVVIGFKKLVQGVELKIKQLKDIIPSSNLYLFINRHFESGDNEKLKLVEELGRQFDIPRVAANDVYYHIPQRRVLQDVLCCIRLRKKIDNAGFSLFPNAERYLKSEKAMQSLFSDYPEALRRSVEIYERTSGFSLDELKYEYPREVCPSNKLAIEYLRELVWEKANLRFKDNISEKVVSQLRHELKIIEELNYAKYFLTVYDIVSYANKKNIFCQGRGAAANSVVCYVLGITAVNPEQINLLFERFISKERKEPPDIDIDFEHSRREEIFQYIYQKYGRHRAALAAAVVTYRTRSAVRDVGKVLALSPLVVENIIRLFSRCSKYSLSLNDLHRYGLSEKDSRTILCIKIAKKLKGFPRHRTQHVGGFVISDEPLSNLVPIENARMQNRSIIEWDKEDIDAMGILKIDLLSLGMLSCIKEAFCLIRQTSASSEQAALELYNVPAEDPNVYKMISRADTLGVFQIESRAQMNMLTRLQPRCFYDLVVEVALVRPGPIQGGMVHPYLKRRCGEEKINSASLYANEKIKQILEPTLGVPIFQEQIIELASVAAGFSCGEADQLRRSISGWTRSSKEVDQFRKRFMDGMIQNKYTILFASSLFEQIRGFGGYGFPQSHAASFALLVYISAWLKYYYPAAFAAALINSQPMGFYSPAQIISDASRHEVEILPVDVNFSLEKCSIEKGGLRLGLCMVKGLSEGVAGKIAANRPYSSLEQLKNATGIDFLALKNLANADAFNSMNISRQKALWQIRKMKTFNFGLFAKIPVAEKETNLPNLFPEEEVYRDYNSIGLSLKGHPVLFHREKLIEEGIISAEQFKTATKNKESVSIAGIVILRQQPPTAHGNVFLTIEDETGIANVIVKPEVAKKNLDILYDSFMLIVKGEAQHIEGTHNVIARGFDCMPL